MDDLDQGSTIRGFSPGARAFNRYLLTRVLGRGGMGVVWLARDQELEREVALKFLPEVVALDPASVAELKRETRRNLELTHPHIVRIYDFVQDARSAAISMEFVDGTSLSTLRLERPERVFPLAEVRGWLDQLGDALTYAHERARIVHRDLKPANLMVNSRGELKVTDFGIATSISDSISRVSGLNNSSGTAVYMSPQQMMGEKPAVTDDLYALGATLFELLTGKPPFYTGNIILQVQNKVPPTLASRREELGIVAAEPVPEAWERAIAACLAKEPADRPQSMRAFRALLEGRNVVEVRSEGAPAPTHIAAPMGGTRGPSRVESPPAERAEISRPTTQVPGFRLPPYLLVAAAVILVGVAGYFLLGRGGDVPGAEPRRLAEDTSRSGTQESAPSSQVPPANDAASISQPAESEPKSPVEPAKVEPVAPAPASLRLTTIPEDAEVRIGERVLRAPLDLTDLPAGPLALVVSKEGYHARSLQFELAAGQSLEVPAIQLQAILQPIELTGRQSGLTYRLRGPDGREAAGSLPDRLELPRGNYLVTVERPGYGEQRRELTVGAEPIRFEANIPGAQLDLTSQPSGATVRSGDRVIGTTPLRLTDQRPGTLPLTVAAQHFDPQSFEASLRGGETWSESVQLVPDATSRALQEMDGYWSVGGFFGSISDSVMHISAAERKIIVTGKFLFRKAILDGLATSYDPDAGGLIFACKMDNWEGNLAVSREGEDLLYGMAGPKSTKLRYKRTTREAFEKSIKAFR